MSRSARIYRSVMVAQRSEGIGSVPATASASVSALHRHCIGTASALHRLVFRECIGKFIGHYIELGRSRVRPPQVSIKASRTYPHTQCTIPHSIRLIAQIHTWAAQIAQMENLG